MNAPDKAWRARLRTPPAFDAGALWSGVQARRARRRSWLRAALALPVLAGALLLLLFARREPLERVDGGSLARIEAGPSGLWLQLSDGSQLELAPGARMRTRALTRESFATELDEGKVTFDVVPNGPRVWEIQAGTTLVRVLGTRFSVERRATDVRVEVMRGRVRVSGPDVPGGSRELQAGQALSTPPSPALPPLAAKTPPQQPTATSPDPQAPTAPRKQARPAPRDVEQALREADEARAQGQPERAAALLARLVAEHPADRRTALAAFTLGELYLSALASPLRAAEAFERAQSLGLPAALAEQGAARIFEAYAAAGRAERAASAARAYLSKHPDGPHRRAAERWAGGQ